MSEVVVLRIGHRPGRDLRISTHAALVARAFGADGIIFSNYEAKKTQESLENVKENWGGSFSVEGGESWRSVIEDWKSSGGIVVHLTMYGLPVNDTMSEIGDDDILVIIGAEKVPGKVYDLADYNVAVGNQPHSEISALAVFLDRLYDGEELERDFDGAKRKIIPSESGKDIREIDS